MRQAPWIQATVIVFTIAACWALSEARAQTLGPDMRVSLEELNGEVVAAITVDNRYGFPVESMMEVEVDGEVVESFPYESVHGAMFFVPVGVPEDSVSACVRMDGLIRFSGDSTAPISDLECVERQGFPNLQVVARPLTPRQPRGTATRLDRRIVPAGVRR